MVGILSFYFTDIARSNREYCENTHMLYEEWDIKVLGNDEVFVNKMVRQLIDNTLLNDYLDGYDICVMYIEFHQHSDEGDYGEDCCDTVEFSSAKMREILGL